METRLNRRLLHQRVMPPPAPHIALVAFASLGLLSCQDRPEQDPGDLDAILRDGDLTLMSRHSLTSAAPVPVGGATGTGGRVGDGGVPGNGGSAPDGGIGGGGMATGGTSPGTGGAGMGGVGGGDNGPFPESAQGLWLFNECGAGRTELQDSTFASHTAFRSVSVACVPGNQELGVGIDEADDYVSVPDQPDFTVEGGVTAAAWVKPKRLGDVRTIFRKREGGTSTFVLLSNGRDYQFVIRLANGRAASVSARGTTNVWTHVAGTYDGTELRLYLDGTLAARSRVVGRLSNGVGPLLMGNDALGRRIDGTLDNVFFDTRAASPEQVAHLTCRTMPPSLVAVPAISPPVPAGTSVAYDVLLKSNDSPTCLPRQALFVQAEADSSGIFPSPNFQIVDSLVPGETIHLPISVSSTSNIEPDDYPVRLTVFTNSPPFDSGIGSLTYSVAGTPCSVRSRKELSIRDLSVVEDPVRTGPGGAWSFGKLMENMAPSAAAAPAMVEGLLQTWLTDQNVNGFTVSARPAMQDRILSTFPRTANGALDLAHAPFRLLAIVNRIDLQDPAKQTAGEGRFVFGVLDADGNPLQLTMILEYSIPAASAADVVNLANAWHALSALTLPSESFNAALQAVTDRFTRRGAAPGRVNGSALGQLRANDFFALGEWEFREFHLSAATGQLVPAPVALTPDPSFNNTQALADFINGNEAAILQEKHTVPETLGGVPFLAGSMITNFFVWNAPGVNPNARAKFAINTCNGCHTAPLEANVDVFQISPRAAGEESRLSRFLLGTDVADFPAGVIRHFNELNRRGRILHGLICPTEPLPPAPPETTPLGGMGGTGGRGGPGTGGVGGRGMPGTGGLSGAGGGPSTGTGGSTGGGMPVPGTM